MPRYTFACMDCKKRFEQMLHMEEVTKTKLKCPDCGSEKVEQQLSVVNAMTGRKSNSTSASGRWR